MRIIDAYETSELAFEKLLEYAGMLRRMSMTDTHGVSMKKLSDGGFGIYLVVREKDEAPSNRGNSSETGDGENAEGNATSDDRSVS